MMLFGRGNSPGTTIIVDDPIRPKVKKEKNQPHPNGNRVHRRKMAKKNRGIKE